MIVNEKSKDGESCPAETFVKMRDDFNQKDPVPVIFGCDQTSWLQIYKLDEQGRGERETVSQSFYYRLLGGLMFQR